MIENDLAYAMYDALPVSPYHSLIIPKRHTKSFFDLNENEILACNRLLQEMREIVLGKGRKITDFNIGVNEGKSAGQSVFHSHIHLIPRRPGDVFNVDGGVRNVIPTQGEY